MYIFGHRNNAKIGFMLNLLTQCDPWLLLYFLELFFYFNYKLGVIH